MERRGESRYVPGDVTHTTKNTQRDGVALHWRWGVELRINRKNVKNNIEKYIVITHKVCIIFHFSLTI